MSHCQIELYNICKLRKHKQHGKGKSKKIINHPSLQKFVPSADVGMQTSLESEEFLNLRLHKLRNTELLQEALSHQYSLVEAKLQRGFSNAQISRSESFVYMHVTNLNTKRTVKME